MTFSISQTFLWMLPVVKVTKLRNISSRMFLSMKFCTGHLHDTLLNDEKNNLDFPPILICGSLHTYNVDSKIVHRNKYHQNECDCRLHCIREEHLFIKNNIKPRMSVLSLLHLWRALGLQDVALNAGCIPAQVPLWTQVLQPHLQKPVEGQSLESVRWEVDLLPAFTEHCSQGFLYGQ